MIGLLNYSDKYKGNFSYKKYPKRNIIKKMADGEGHWA